MSRHYETFDGLSNEEQRRIWAACVSTESFYPNRGLSVTINVDVLQLPVTQLLSMMLIYTCITR